MTREQFNALIQADIVRMMHQSPKLEKYVLDHIAADGPCGFNHINQWVQHQLPDGTDTGEILEILINNGEIVFCHASQAYEVNI